MEEERQELHLYCLCGVIFPRLFFPGQGVGGNVHAFMPGAIRQCFCGLRWRGGQRVHVMWPLKTGLQDHVVRFVTPRWFVQRRPLLTWQGQYHLFLSRPDHGLNVFDMLSILCSVCGLERGLHGGLFPLRIEDRRVSVQTRRTEVPAHVHFAGGAEEPSVSRLFLGHWVLDKRQGMVESLAQKDSTGGEANRAMWGARMGGIGVVGGRAWEEPWANGPPITCLLGFGLQGNVHVVP